MDDQKLDQLIQTLERIARSLEQLSSCVENSQTGDSFVIRNQS